MLLRPLVTAPPACAAWSSCLQRFKFNNYLIIFLWEIRWIRHTLVFEPGHDCRHRLLLLRYVLLNQEEGEVLLNVVLKEGAWKSKKKIIKLWRLLEETLNQSSTYAQCPRKRLEQNISFFSFMRYTYIMLYVWERENKKQFEKNGNFLSYLVLLSQDRERQCFKQCFYLEF